MRLVEIWRETFEAIAQTRALSLDEVRNLKADNARLKKAASKLIMQAAKDFGTEVTNQESC